MGYPSIYPTGVTVYDPEQAWSGYTLFQAPGVGALLIDMQGREVQLWQGLQGFPNKLVVRYRQQCFARGAPQAATYRPSRAAQRDRACPRPEPLRASVEQRRAAHRRRLSRFPRRGQAPRVHPGVARAAVRARDRFQDGEVAVQVPQVPSGADTSRAELSLDDSALIYAGNTSSDLAAPQYALYAYDFSSFASANLVPPSAILISPDGVWVAAAFDCPGSDRSSLWASPYSVTTPACEGRRITHPDAVTATNPTWGPGLLIAYERGEPPRDIAIVAADTGDECVLPGLGDERNPSWYVEPPSDVR